MLKEMPELRAPENRRTGMEIRPKVRYPDQTEAAIIVRSQVSGRQSCARSMSVTHSTKTGAAGPAPGEPHSQARPSVSVARLPLQVVLWNGYGRVGKRWSGC